MSLEQGAGLGFVKGHASLHSHSTHIEVYSENRWKGLQEIGSRVRFPIIPKFDRLTMEVKNKNSFIHDEF